MTDKAVLQIVGYKNSGKTTTVCEMIKRFTQNGLKVGSIKHDAHDFKVDYPGKDTWLHREAGASVVAITSKEEFVIMEQRPICLQDLIQQINGVDVIVVEGFKFEEYPKVVIVKDQQDLLLVQEAKEIIAIFSWIPFDHPSIPVILNNDYQSLFNVIQSKLFSNNE